MPHENYWLIEKRVLFQRYWGDVTVEETRIAMDEVDTYLKSLQAFQMHVIVDLSNVANSPKKLSVLRDASKYAYKHPKMGWGLLYGRKDLFMIFIANTVAKLFKTRLRLCNSKRDALEFLINIDSELAARLQKRSKIE